jgi:hypothetical protein
VLGQGIKSVEVDRDHKGALLPPWRLRGLMTPDQETHYRVFSWDTRKMIPSRGCQLAVTQEKPAQGLLGLAVLNISTVSLCFMISSTVPDFQ